MEKKLIVCDRCEAVIPDRRRAAQLTFAKVGRKSGLNPLDLCTTCKEGLTKWLSGK